MTGTKRYVVGRDRMPPDFPTHLQKPLFWETLGRTVATFGFLEETLAKAVFALTGTREVSVSEINEKSREWLDLLQRTASDPLNKRIDAFGKAVRSHPEATIENLDDLLQDLKKAATFRNALCHGSWRKSDSDESSHVEYLNKKGEVFDAAIDTVWLKQMQDHTVDLVCGVINVVTHMGWQFPGTNGSGRPLRSSG